MILVDFSGILFQNIFGAINATKPSKNEESGKYKTSEFMPVARAFILSSLFKIQQEHSATKGEICICLDNTRDGNWRKDLLKTYKSSRKEGRENSEIHFGEVFDDIDEFIEQLRTNTPWRVVDVKHAEGDDVILCLAKHYAKTEPILIISADKDMIQAQRHGNVVQYSPLTRKWVTPETKGGNMDFWLTEHVILGDDADEVPRITERTEFSIPFKDYLKKKGYSLTPRTFNQLSNEEQILILDDFDVLTKKGNKDVWKQPRLGSSTIQKMLENGTIEEWLDSNDLYRENYERNKRLVLDDFIPTEIYNSSITNYIESKKSISKENTVAFKKYLCSSGLERLTLDLPLNFIANGLDWGDF
jgi:hypothetical protein